VIALRRVPFTPAWIPFSGYLYQMTDMLYGHADVKHETHPTAVLNDGGKMMTPKRNKQPPEKVI
jgi:hypothetical protein